MPSAANVKIDKQISPENALTDSSCNSCTPLKQAITIIEHKIRNLEKRKAKLESYRDLQNAGKELNSDQKTAVAKYNEVVQTLEFARDLSKQFLGIVTTSEKEAKKQAKKEAAARNQADLAKLREVLLIQDALNILGYAHVREDFLNGKRGAAQLTQADLELLDELYPAVTPKHEAGNPTAFTNEVQAAAEHLLAVVDGKPKEVFGGTYSQIKEILGKIHESGYLDQVHEEQEEQEAYVETFTEQEAAPLAEPPVNNEVVQPEPQQQLAPIESLTIEPSMPPMQPQPPVEQPPVEPPLPPEQSQIFYQQPPRPLAEMLGTGNFFFLQESEVDPTLDQIPSQTFTNQSYVTAPPPPIPMPPHFQNIPAAIPPTVPPTSNNIEENHKPTEEHKPTNNNRPRTSSNNQSYYQNNGYNNNSNTSNNDGPRQRSRGRPSNNRHN